MSAQERHASIVALCRMAMKVGDREKVESWMHYCRAAGKRWSQLEQPEKARDWFVTATDLWEMLEDKR